MKRFKSLWDRLLFRDKGIVPTKKLLSFYALFLLAIFILSLWQFSWLFLLIATLLIVSVLVIDAFLLPNKANIEVKRAMEKEIERYEKQKVVIHIQNHMSAPFIVRLKDELPASFSTTFPSNIDVPSNGKVEIPYEMLPELRGNYTIDRLFLRFQTKWGLWEKQITYSIPNEVKVIPNLSETKRYLASAQNYLLTEGIKIRKMKSGVGEFSKVRGYVVGDDPRKINWRQSAKLQEMMTNEYEPEHGKNITILLDCGRMMGVELEEGNRLEKSIEAAITLAAAALQNGDNVSVIAFSKEIKRVIPNGKGLDHLNTILQGVYDLQIDAQESNYALALQHAQSIQRKRSMILLFSDVQTFANEDYQLAYLKKLRKKHLFVTLGIQDLLLQEQIKIKPKNVLTTMEKGLAQKQYLNQKQVMNKWEKHGLPMLEAPAERLAVTSVSHYIDTLNRGLI
ncbi:DUF58 domain-containing protein [Gracilibacillus sp. S3-1-1]|uniref:DUF58 domain-containing protein n=1 Tax=Gracilibacillus pellucidus TaxID=3095368 RepID=A0ACC6M651_9BACI|nr:DUF58 domain-containing protein [Gracilibacillus sp. S3-1-1]MDX8046388.1 DUF58 domain-containing protein [Gracilibacillus sp. S3-1-1]